MTDRVQNLWNFIVFKFAPEISQCEQDEVKEEKQDDKQKDMHYRIKQMEYQVESLLKHQKIFMEEMRMNYKNIPWNYTTMNAKFHTALLCKSVIMNAYIL